MWQREMWMKLKLEKYELSRYYRNVNEREMWIKDKSEWKRN